MLVEYLGDQRCHVLGAIDGLDESDLRRAMLPTGWSFLGLINHLAVDVERFWFGAVFAAEPAVIAGFEAGPSKAWEVPGDREAAQVIAAYQDECDRADRIIAATPLQGRPQWWWPGQGSPHIQDLRQGILHVIVEIATHAGHLDAARELLDRRTWLVID